MIRVSRRQFEQIVRETIEALPAHLREAIHNVEIEIRSQPTRDDFAYAAEAGEEAPEGETLFGLYRGIPLTERSSSYDLVLPDLITIFQRPHEEACNTLEELKEEVAITVRHEIAHYFGIDDNRLEELGAY
ncbi:MAG: metallopeptidase family protein [Anaerolineae bacterium]|nr:metallopeptidase family protein [Thermoflexales bacterium]MDW8407380.1 metallopeptidase family protein [Anaerolineae bacterium]